MTRIALPRHLDMVRSDIAGVAWPPLTSNAHAPLILAAERLERSQWFDPDRLLTGQHRQLVILATHAAQHSPLFGRRMRDAGLVPADLATPAGLRALPTLTRAQLQVDPAQVDCAVLPTGHAPVGTTTSSGSTGEPVRVRRTAINSLFWRAQTLRWHLWTREDLRGRLAVVRADVKQPGQRASWGNPINLLYATGPSFAIDVSTDIATMGESLRGFDPHSLLIYGNVLEALLQRIDTGLLELPSLVSARLLGETVPDALRETAKGRIKLNSCYSSMEMGYLTIECPDSGLHHIMSETAIVEVLDDAGEPAKEGEHGRVVVTDLHNFATPLIRYENGDWATVGPRCSCGRGLPTLSRILGRSRNMMTLPDGRKRWPLTSAVRAHTVSQITQIQVIQHSLDRLELRYTAPAPLTDAEKLGMTQLTHDATDPAFTVDFTYVAERLNNPKTGKFEEFISHVR